MRFIATGTLCALVAVVALIAASPAAPANGHGAIVSKGFGCFVNLPPFAGTTTDTHLVITPSGNASLVCHFDLVNPTGQAATFRGFGCLVGSAGPTTDSKFTVSASGQGTLVCQVKHS